MRPVTPDLWPAEPDPAAALREVAFWLEFEGADSRRCEAFRRAAAVWTRHGGPEVTDPQKLTGLGPSTAAVVKEAMAGEVPQRLRELRERAEPVPGSDTAMYAALRGDLHTHSTWSDGGAPIADMVEVAGLLSHEYYLVTDHSPRLKVANGLDATRLQAQADEIAALNTDLRARGRGPVVLHGSEVDILADGGLDHSPASLDGLDAIVASVHSDLRSDAQTMTRRMVRAIAHPSTTVLGHCTGRKLARGEVVRPPSDFDAEVVFAACAAYGVAVEINARPERQDPPEQLLELAASAGCLFSIDSDAHATGQLTNLALGCQRAEAVGIDADRVITTWSLERLRAWLDDRG
ncbi:PHP domain-containing protein [Parenemella sanctibonifatiensis]|uniref:PHP domain-containing protein n=1 Tax=Parenemella sanctibonifatiensis TaxID=2016505 RepID=A0A255EH30_9ACTN|nr:PHP domain-containing protein [Parenemella sanctibonifatiensis]OYN85355.1 PHP domain-containing protein [Parenemella sanctibonifatiensis]OYN90836.1 PHP domain-containing protein [Parenemella sanctibonifatiensis]